jgi:glucose-1-phosphate thymidylyltransferase
LTRRGVNENPTETSGLPELVAVLPAAGRARRLGRLPCSKEILPIPDRAAAAPRLTTGIEIALAAARIAGAVEAAVVLSPSKGDIRTYLGDGERHGIPITYLEAADSRNSPDTVSRAASWAGSRDMLLLFPDILWEPVSLLARLAGMRGQGADVSMLLVPSDRGDKVDLVSVDRDGRVLDLAMKPGAGHAGLTWTCARWSARFTRFLCQILSHFDDGLEGEMHIGHVVACAIRSGFEIRGAVAPEGRSLDIGTPDDFFLAWGLQDLFEAGTGRGRSGLS